MAIEATDDSSSNVDMDDLDAFEAEFFNRVKADKEEAKQAESSENEDDALATEESPEDPAEETPEETQEEEEPKEEPKPKGKKTFQDRIDELTRGKREAERREADLIRRLEALEVRKSEETKTEPQLREQLATDAPHPDALNDKGERVYPLGEFDPSYIRDLTRYTIKVENETAKAEADRAAHQEAMNKAQQELSNSWAEKVDAAQEELPDIREKLSEMEVAFKDINPQYGEYLAATIMSCDNGPQLMYYLSQNIGEAQKIVASGPAAAALAIGRLDAKFAKAPVEEKQTKKVSKAPTPPAARSRGSGSSPVVAGDTDDLDAFERVFFNK